METIRQSKVARLIQKELADIFQKDAHNYLPGGIISVTTVRVSPDLSYAKSYLSVFPTKEPEEVLKKIEDNKKQIRHELGNRVKKQLRIVPELGFGFDDSLDYIENIHNLLKKE